MSNVNIAEWNRQLVTETLISLQQSIEAQQKAMGQLRDFLAVNPGGETVPFVGNGSQSAPASAEA